MEVPERYRRINNSPIGDRQTLPVQTNMICMDRIPSSMAREPLCSIDYCCCCCKADWLTLSTAACNCCEALWYVAALII